jgi:hypothetical protein
VTESDLQMLAALRSAHALHHDDRRAHARVHREIAAFFARRGRPFAALKQLLLMVFARFA